jgi:hypothetical protein
MKYDTDKEPRSAQRKKPCPTANFPPQIPHVLAFKISVLWNITIYENNRNLEIYVRG